MSSSRVILAYVHLSVFATVLHAQAAVEYAARSAGSVLSSGGTEIHLGVCGLNSALVSCVHQYYPTPFYVALLAGCVLLGMLLRPTRRS